MNLNPKSLLTVAMFKAAFCVEENTRSMARNMAVSKDSGYKGFRAEGKSRKRGRSYYELESLFKVAELMGPSCFKGGVVPTPERHILPAREMVFGDFMAVLFLNGNKVGNLDSNGELYVRFHNSINDVRARKLRDGRNGKLYHYDDLASAAEKCGWRVPPLPGVWPRPQGEAVCAPETKEKRMQQGELPMNAVAVADDDGKKQSDLPVTTEEIDSEFCGVEGTRCLQYIATALTGIEGSLDRIEGNGDSLIDCVKETNRLLSELLKEWKGDKR